MIERTVRTLRAEIKKNVLEVMIGKGALSTDVADGIANTLREFEDDPIVEIYIRRSQSGEEYKVDRFGDIRFYHALKIYSISEEESSIDDIIRIANSEKHTMMERQRALALRFLLENNYKQITSRDIAHATGWGESFVAENMHPLIINVNSKSAYFEIIEVREQIAKELGLYQSRRLL